MSGIKRLANLGGKPFRRSFRGRPIKSKISLTVEAPTADFLRKTIRWELGILRYTGLAALRQYRRLLGKRSPRMLTKAFSITKRFREEIEQGQRHKYPYRRIGTLQKYSNFEIREARGDVIAGPMFFAPGAGATRSNKTVPQLLNEGGPASTLVPEWKKITVSDKRKGRKRRATKKYFYKRTGATRQRVNYRSLEWTGDLRVFAAKAMLKGMRARPLGG